MLVSWNADGIPLSRPLLLREMTLKGSNFFPRCVSILFLYPGLVSGSGDPAVRLAIKPYKQVTTITW